MGAEAKDYFGREKALAKEISHSDLKQKMEACTDFHGWKRLFRSGVPDVYKREVLLRFFNLTSESAERTYGVIKEQAG